ncbi:MAG: DUF2141 domain-containing protein [Planctomycetota bacterium]
MKIKNLLFAMLAVGIGSAFWVAQADHPTSCPTQAHAQAASVEGALYPGVLTLNLRGLTEQGPIRVGIFNTGTGFPKPAHTLRSLTVPVEAADAPLHIDDLPPGTYAIAVYQDVNDNGKMDKSGFGIPTEPYGFSNNARGTMGPPSFQKAAFAVADAGVALEIQLK